MKHAIRALGWITIILWMWVIPFSGTVVYSATRARMNFDEDPEVTASAKELAMSLPFSISNGGLYDISELNIACARLLRIGEKFAPSHRLSSEKN